MNRWIDAFSNKVPVDEQEVLKKNKKKKQNKKINKKIK